MKRNLLILPLLFLSFTACKDQQKKAMETKSETAEIVEIPKIEIECYQYIQDKDSIFLKLKINGAEVQGDLTYSLYQKDRNQGTFRGKMSGDSLFADYNFQAEGTSSIREIFFVKTDSGLIEGYGPVIQKSEKTEFKNRNSLKLNTDILLERVSCTY